MRTMNMKKLILPALLFSMLHTTARAQDTTAAPEKRETPVYIKYPELPAFNILLTDSITTFNTFSIPKGRPVMLVFFDPDCKHCKAETKELVAGMDSLSNIDIYFISPSHSMTDIRRFAGDNHLKDFSNVKLVGRDYEFFFATYYDVKFVPDIALYDDHKKILRLFEGHARIKELYDYTHRQ